ncbi:MAG: DUF2087 domain-containing protein [Calditrichaeota bacterium]|nr:MAG: DUF2087 domain-containing protein [Calditrichota bacterium]
MSKLKNFMDENGKLKQWSSKSKNQKPMLEFLAEKFEFGIDYTEKEVNEILNNFHTFKDSALLRRELFEQKFLDRTENGSRYWKIKKNAD